MKPNAEEFAKEMLWQLALARAEIHEIKLLVAEVLVEQTGQIGAEVQDKWKSKSRAAAEKIYKRAAMAVGLQDSQIPDHNGEF